MDFLCYFNDSGRNCPIFGKVFFIYLTKCALENNAVRNLGASIVAARLLRLL